MSFLDKMKSAAGVGGEGVSADVQQRPGKRGDELVATLRVACGKQAQKLAYVVVTVMWQGDWEYKNGEGNVIQVRNGEGYVLLDKPASTINTTLQPGSTLEIPIRVRIPADAPLTAEKLKWKFYARADIEGAKDPTFETPLEIRG